MKTMPPCAQWCIVISLTSEASEIDEVVLNAVKRKVTPEMNQGLLAPFSYKEVKHTLFSIGD
jgi:hypothetical protein